MLKPLCTLDNIPDGKTLSFSLDSSSYIISRKNNQVYVYLNQCPHLGIPLEWEAQQFIDSETALIRCASHGALFIHETGECVAGPCYGARLQAIPFQVKNDVIFIN